ncbi:MAG TPA: enoyl-ACP reductase, partial [Nitrospira sp.]|nr:enoyl-ACP reductase [Nitrospira sp.]HNA25624.1 enoyl-ACP reductase [Nitrospira sp.]HNN41194.1 enoyl-ACP reductase [Nitrospira sp.]HUM38298.1 enoyl-ACP reductase [Nitrospira sp.]
MLLEGKKGLIIGVANKHSIAWAIAQAAAREGAQMLFSYQNERLRENVEELVQTLPGASACVCDVGDDNQIAAMMKQASEKLGRLDFVVHSLAFAPREELTGEFVNTTRQGFATALDVSAYSLVAVTRAAMPLMTEGGSVVTLTYLGSERVVPHYNVMGVAKAALEATVRYLAHDLGPKNIRVNAVSAGPIKTLAARGVSGISKMVDHHRAFAPLRRATEQGEVGDTALFLVSPLGRGITGEVIYVDGGYHILG